MSASASASGSCSPQATHPPIDATTFDSVPLDPPTPYAGLCRPTNRPAVLSDDEGKAVTRHDKLVRDRIPELIAENDEDAEYRFVTGEAHLQTLLTKLAEEAAEFDAERSVKELADLYEVIRALAILTGHEFDEVVHLAAQKRTTHGGLLEGVYLLTTS